MFVAVQAGRACSAPCKI